MQVLDCTLRDGGYYTNWDFDKDLFIKYLNYMNELPVDFLEIGYRSEPKKEYFGEFFFLPKSTLNLVKQYSKKKISIMLNAKDVSIDNLDDITSGLNEVISMIRIAANPYDFDASLNLATELLNRGFKVALNVMYISKVYDDSSFYESLKKIDQRIEFLYLVDSYGGIYPDQMKLIVKKVKEQTKLKLGFHGHNNLELAFANTLSAIDAGVDIVDSTILGMGRGAGNLKTEHYLAYLKAQGDQSISLNTLGQITELFQGLHSKYKWGTNLAYMVSGYYDLPQKDVMEALEISRYSLSGIINRIKNEGMNNYPILGNYDSYEEAFIVGGGDSVREHQDAIVSFLNENPKILVIHSTSKNTELFAGIKNNRYFAVSGEELLKIKDSSNINKWILESSPRKVNYPIHLENKVYELEQDSFFDDYKDSPLSISLGIVKSLMIKETYLVGFDGYSELKNKKELYLMQETQFIINKYTQSYELCSLTPTKYQNLKQNSVYSKLSK